MLQAANYLFPLITLPYLVRVLGTETYGLLAFAQAFMNYFIVLTDYGFNLTATREIATHREDLQKVSEIFSKIMLIKFGLLLASFPVVAAVVFAVPKFRDDWAVYLVTFLMVLGTVMFPLWFFQGMEAMKYIAILNVISRAIATISIFIFVQSETDYLLAAGLQAGAVVLSGILGLWTARRVASIRLTRPSLQQTKAAIREGWYVFVSQGSNILKANSGIFVLGLFYGNLAVGYYAIAQKVILAAASLSVPINSAIYPRVIALFREASSAAIEFLRRTLRAGGLAFIAVSLSLFFGADLIVQLITGEVNDSISTLIKIMAIVPFLDFADNIYGTQVLLSLGKTVQFMKAILYSGIFCLITTLLLVLTFGAAGSAVAFVASQVLVLVLMVIPVHRMGIKLHGSAS